MRQDLEHLRLLAIFHYILGGLTFVCACFPFIHVGMGIAMVKGAFDNPRAGQPPPKEFGWFFIIVGGAAIFFGWAYSVGLIIAGRCLQRHRGYIFCMVMAALSCLQIPLGSVLGVFTILVLCRPGVRVFFGREPGDAYLDDNLRDQYGEER
jgi:hypothetical protein